MAIALVAAQANNNGAVTSTTDPINSSTANFILGAVAYYGNDIGGSGAKGPFTASDVSDNQSNSYTALTDYRALTGANAQIAMRLFYCASPTVSASHTFTGGSGAGGAPNIFPGVALIAFSGVQLASPFDVENGNTVTATSTSVNVGSISAAATAVAITAIVLNESTAGVSAPSGFTIPTNGSTSLNGGIPALGIAIAYKLNAGTVTNPTWTGSTDIRAAAIASFLAASSGGFFGRPYYDQIPQGILNV